MIDYRYSADDNVIHVDISGVMTVDDVLGYFERIKADSRIARGAAEWVVFSDIEDLPVALDESIRMRDAFAVVVASVGIERTTFNADSDLSLGIANMLAAVCETDGHTFVVQRLGDT